MLRLQSHRGPDGRALRPVDQGEAILGHCRLAIIDPEGGEQPLETRDGSWSLIANGMIYNDEELRGEIPATAYRTGSDSESILHLITRHGPQAVSRLDGMFAFVLANSGRLIAARDPIGIKPLYFGE
ncbi:MAG: asparagine synthetase B, partial [Alphaproteobacteria bacterium]|nr:asparagine synthetase B [Alphaproteobacteria bacterium]